MSSIRFLSTNLLTDGTAGICNGTTKTYTAGASGLRCLAGGDPKIYREDGGSFIADRVRRQMRLQTVAGSISTHFNAGAYVISVAKSELTMSVNANTDSVTLKAGTFSPSVAQNEIDPYLVDNLLNDDRRVVWVSNGGVATDFDLGANRNVTFAGAHGMRGVNGGTITQLTVYWANTATGYPPATGGTWGVAGVMNVFSARDFHMLFANISARYWRFEVSSGSADQAVGKFSLGVISPDLGIVYSPGSSMEDRTPVTIERTLGEDPVLNYLGDDRRTWNLQYLAINDAFLNTLRQLVRRRKSLIMIDNNDTTFEVIVPEAALSYSHRFIGLYDASLELEQLG